MNGAMAVTKNKKKSIDRHEASSGETRLIDAQNDTLRIDIERAKSKSAVLIVIRGTTQGTKFDLEEDEIIIGRSEDAPINLGDTNISRQHCSISKQGDELYIEDLGSRNGTFVNDKKIKEKVKLSKEDMIKVGTTVLKYIPAGELEILYQDNLTNAAYYDELTQVFNRNYISQILESEFKRAKALHTSFPITIFDIDDFKKVNDTYGHAAGDYVLRQITAIIKATGLRDRDLLGRWGGEEFILLVVNSTVDEAMNLSERVRKAVEKYEFKYQGKKFPITISMGVASIKKEHNSYEDLYRDADEALYKSKETGKNRITLFKG